MLPVPRRRRETHGLQAPDLSQSNMDLESRVALITYGKGTMPPQKGILDAATIRGIAEYIETFRDVK